MKKIICGRTFTVNKMKDGSYYTNMYKDTYYHVDGVDAIKLVEEEKLEELNNLPEESVGVKWNVFKKGQVVSKPVYEYEPEETESKPVIKTEKRNYMYELMQHNHKWKVEESKNEFNDSEKEMMLNTIDNLQNFFKEFDFNPAARFINTLSNKCVGDIMEGMKYTEGYFKLSGHPEADNIALKIKSEEYKSILQSLLLLNKHNKVINKRLEVYYGEPGVGKTTKVMKENKDADVIVMNSLMNEQDLLETPSFDKDGILMFKPSPLLEAIVLGKTIILDELNLANMQVLRFLQGLCDAKEYFTFTSKSNDTIKVYIHPDFKIIGTMNLYVNGQIYNLPEPLVDRCQNIVELKMTNARLLSIAF